MDPTIFDLSFNQASVVTDRQPLGRCRPASSCRRPRSGDHRSPHRAAARSRVRPGDAAAPAVEDGHLRLDLVHALAIRAAARRRLGALRLRSPAPLQPGRRGAAAPQLGSRPSAAVPERPPHHDDGRVQRRLRHGLLSLRLSRRQARRLAQVAARLLRRRHQRRAAARGGPAGHGPPLRAAHRRRARPVHSAVLSPSAGGRRGAGAGGVGGAGGRRAATRRRRLARAVDGAARRRRRARARAAGDLADGAVERRRRRRDARPALRLGRARVVVDRHRVVAGLDGDAGRLPAARRRPRSSSRPGAASSRCGSGWARPSCTRTGRATRGRAPG